MRIKSFILVALALAIATFVDFSLAGGATPVKTPADGQAKEATAMPSPFENYWAAQSWDADGSVFWHAKETPVQPPQKEPTQPSQRRPLLKSSQ